MPVYLKQVQPPSEEKNAKTSEIVSQILQDIEKGGEQKVYEYAAKFDGYTVGETEAENSLILSQLQIEEKIALVPEQIKTDIQFAYGNIKKFAEMQRSCIQDMQFETSPGFLVGQKCIPLESCGAYVPGGRYSHIASALMTV
jgi:sulfopropanediol 3-dehydrogenase